MGHFILFFGVDVVVVVVIVWCFVVVLFALFFVFETGSWYVAHPNLELKILLPQVD